MEKNVKKNSLSSNRADPLTIRCASLRKHASSNCLQRSLFSGYYPIYLNLCCRRQILIVLTLFTCKFSFYEPKGGPLRPLPEPLLVRDAGATDLLTALQAVRMLLDAKLESDACREIEDRHGSIYLTGRAAGCEAGGPRMIHRDRVLGVRLKDRSRNGVLKRSLVRVTRCATSSSPPPHRVS